MTGFDDRKKAQETKFAKDEEVKFKITARRRKLLALWAAEISGMNEEDSLEYAIEIVKFGISKDSVDSVVEKILSDAKDRSADITEEELKQKNAEFAEIAKKQIIEQIQH